MLYKLNKWLLLATFILLPFFSMAQNNNTNINVLWSQYDLFERKGLDNDATKQLQVIIDYSKQHRLEGDLWRAVMLKIEYDERKRTSTNKANEEFSPLQMLSGLDILKTNDVNKALVAYVKAKSIRDYYTDDDDIKRRTPLLAKPSELPVGEWTSVQYQDTINSLMEYALSYKPILVGQSVAPYRRLVFGNNNTTSKQEYHSLYELMLIDYLTNALYDINNNLSSFSKQINIDAETICQTASEFIEQKWDISDATLSKAVAGYQSIIAYYLQVKDKENLAKWELDKLNFLVSYFTVANMDKVQIQALEALIANYSGTNAALDAWLQLHEKKSYLGLLKNKEFASLLEKKIIEHKQQPSARNLQGRLAALKRASVSLKIEAHVPVNENAKFLVSYENASQVQVAVLPFTKRLRNEQDEDYYMRLKTIAPKKTYQIALPNAADLEEHSLEHVLDPLPSGTYTILIVDSSDRYSRLYNHFQVTNISYIQYNDEIIVVNRNSGQPLSGASISIYEGNRKKIALSTNAAGKAVIKSGDYNYYDSLVISHNGDKYVSSDFYTDYYGERSKQKDATDFFIFTDRSIYRPGQTIYFKAIALSSNGQKAQVLANKLVTIVFRNANGQDVEKIQLTTNDYGSVHGSFVAPSEGLMGTMSLKIEDNHSINIKVEEYKRPQFAVIFDTLNKTYYALDTIAVEGRAKAYAGNALNDATVSYTIERQVFFPYKWRCYWWPLPPTKNEIISNGVTTTNADGKFAINFAAIPDNSNPELWPVFTYVIKTKVTDINGETHEFTQTVNAGYKDAIIKTNIVANSTEKDVQSIMVAITNVNGIPFNNKAFTLKVSQLKTPQFRRARLWPTPDQFLYDEPTFRKLFPKDVYKDELQPEKMEVVKVTLNQQFTTNQKIDLLQQEAIKESGWYVVSVVTQDTKGQEVEEKQYIYVYLEEDKLSQQALFLHTNQKEYQPGDLLKLKVWTPNENQHLFTYLATNKGIEASVSNTLQVAEQHRGGLYYEVFYVKDNRAYQQDVYVATPYTNKELTIKRVSFRDMLLPGAKETWKWTITGYKAQQLEAEALASMYDASLDALYKDGWYYNHLMPSTYKRYNNVSKNFGSINTGTLNVHYQGIKLPRVEGKSWGSIPAVRMYQFKRVRLKYVGYGRRITKSAAPSARAYMESAPQALADSSLLDDGLSDKNTSTDKHVDGTHHTVRTNFNETAYFLPQLKTDAQGNLSFEFTMPESVTTWKWRTFAHTKDWKLGYLEGEVQTQKDIMVQPNMPRFFRQGDSVLLITKVSNTTSAEVNANVKLYIANAATGQDLKLPFVINKEQQTIAIPAGQSKEVSWIIRIPESLYEPVAVKIEAQAGNHIDGEEHIIPIITNRMLVTETMPLPLLGNETKSFVFNPLMQNKSTTLANKSFTIEYTSNPLWYVVQSLPYLTSYPYDCSEQLFSKFYGNAIANEIIQSAPRIKQTLAAWNSLDSAALWSKLEQNQELKTALLEETPWVMEAASESEQKKRLSQLLATHNVSKDLDKTLKLLGKRQMSNGAFSWFDGMSSNRYITQTIVLGMLKMKQLNISVAKKGQAETIVNKAIPYLSQQLTTDYNNIKINKLKKEDNQLSPEIVQYLLIDALYNSTTTSEAKKYYLQQIVTYWKNYSLLVQAQMAQVLYYNKDVASAQQIIESIRQRAIEEEELGMYWKQNTASYQWFEAPIEAQAELIQTFQLVGSKGNEISKMQTWLLKNKQTNRWHTTKATVEAINALIPKNEVSLDAVPKVTIQVGSQTIESSKLQQQEGTGYFKYQLQGKEVKSDLGTIKVSVNNAPNNLPSWGAVYWQYFEDMNKIAPAPGKQLNIRKQVFVATSSKDGTILVPITAEQPIKMGDKVVVRLVITADRDMEYIHIKDTRAGCLEPKDVLSKYEYKSKLGYYISTKDISTNYFIDRLPKGSYVLEYETYANAKGVYSSGMATIQSMYAPEFSAHSAGSKVIVK